MAITRVLLLFVCILDIGWQQSWAMRDVLVNKIFPHHIEPCKQLVRCTQFALVCKEWYRWAKPCIKMIKHKIANSPIIEKDRMLNDVAGFNQENLGLVTFLVRCGAHPQGKRKCPGGYWQNGAWAWSIESQKLATMYYFANTCKVNINQWTGRGTPLMVACKNGDVPLVKLVLEKGADYSLWRNLADDEVRATCAYAEASKSVKCKEIRKLLEDRARLDGKSCVKLYGGMWIVERALVNLYVLLHFMLLGQLVYAVLV